MLYRNPKALHQGASAERGEAAVTLANLAEMNEEAHHPPPDYTCSLHCSFFFWLTKILIIGS